MPTVTLKISDDEKALWVESARCAEITLSEWIRRRCQGEPVTQQVAYLDRVAPLAVDPNASPFEMPVLQKDEKERRPVKKECSHARNHRPGAFCKFCFKSY